MELKKEGENFLKVRIVHHHGNWGLFVPMSQIKVTLHQLRKPFLAFSSINRSCYGFIIYNHINSIEQLCKHTHHQFHMFIKLISQSYFHECQGWEVFIFHKFYNLNHNKFYHCHELKMDHITIDWKKFLSNVWTLDWDPWPGP
jgi:hypothetical protein